MNIKFRFECFISVIGMVLALYVFSGVKAEAAGGHLVERVEGYPWRVDGNYFYSGEECDMAIGFPIVYDHILTYGPNKYESKVYRMYNYHNLFFEVAMDMNPEFSSANTLFPKEVANICNDDERILVYRGFWIEGTLDVLCQWAYYENLECGEYKKDSEAFYNFFGLEVGGS